MRTFLARSVQRIFGNVKLLAILRFGRYYLTEVGWLDSLERGRPVDQVGAAIPWLTYAAVHFLKAKQFRDLSVLEYGCGSSTVWWAERARSVFSVEHDVAFFDETRKRVPGNVELVLRSQYCGLYESAPVQAGKIFDIVVIDAVNRLECLEAAFSVLKAGGVIIFDNSLREEYGDFRGTCAKNGFRYIDFVGPTAISPFNSCTTIFYKDGNCLGI